MRDNAIGSVAAGALDELTQLRQLQLQLLNNAQVTVPGRASIVDVSIPFKQSQRSSLEAASAAGRAVPNKILHIETVFENLQASRQVPHRARL